MSLVWRLLAPVYDRHARRVDPIRRKAIAATAIAPDDRILLAGCGTGRALRWLPPTASIVAVDRSRAMIECTRRRAADLEMAVDAHVGDASSLDLGDGTVDVVCLHLLLSVADQPAAILREAARVLGRTGRLSLIMDTGKISDPHGLVVSAGFDIADRLPAPAGCLSLVAVRGGAAE